MPENLVARSSAPDSPVRRAGRLYGKYRGVVTNNFDFEGLGRIMAYVPHLPGQLTNWAMPCSPYAGPGVGFWAIPPLGANVWIEFEGGDPTHPIWSGGFWDLGEFVTPQTFSPGAPQLVCLWKTHTATFALNNLPALGGATLQVIPPAVALPITMTFTSEGAKITIGSSTFKMTGVTVETTTVDVTSTAAKGIAANAGATFGVKAGADASVQAGGSVGLKAGGDASMQAGGSATVQAGGSAAMKAGASAQVVGGTEVTVASLGPLTQSGRAVTISGSAISFVPG